MSDPPSRVGVDHPEMSKTQSARMLRELGGYCPIVKSERTKPSWSSKRTSTFAA